MPATVLGIPAALPGNVGINCCAIATSPVRHVGSGEDFIAHENA